MSTNYGFEPTLSGLNSIDADSSTSNNIVCDTLTVNLSGTAPTMSSLDNSTNIATTAFVNSLITTSNLLPLNNTWTGNTNTFQKLVKVTDPTNVLEMDLYSSNSGGLSITLFQNSQSVGSLLYPISVTVPIGNVVPFLRVTIPFNLMAFKPVVGTAFSGDITLNYTSLTSCSVLKNFVAYSTPTGVFNNNSAGLTRTWTGLVTPPKSTGFIAYMGNIEMTVALTIGNTTADTYSFGFNIAGSITPSNWVTNGFSLYVCTAGFNNTFLTFTTTHNQTPSAGTYTSTDPTNYVAYNIISGAQSASNIVTNNDLYITSNTALTTTSQGPMLFQTMAVSGGINFIAYESFQFEAITGYWTAISNTNFYFRTNQTIFTLYFGQQGAPADWASITVGSTGMAIDAGSLPLMITTNGSLYVQSGADANFGGVTQTNVGNTSSPLVLAGSTKVTVVCPILEIQSQTQFDVPSIIKTSYVTYPIVTPTNAIGYFNSTTTSTKFTTAAANMASLSIPCAGCYLCEAQFMFLTPFIVTQYTTQSLSTTSATLDNKRQNTIFQSVSGGYGNHITSIVNFTAASTIYMVGLSATALGATNLQTNYLSITRIA